METSPDKPVYMTVGADNFEDILLGENASDMLRSDAELVDYISESGVARKCWDRFYDYHGSLFGPPTVETRNNIAETKTDEGGGDEGENEYPEAEIDAIRAEKDVQLQQYILEADRKEQLLKKMYSDIPSKPVATMNGSSRNKENGNGSHEVMREAKRRDEDVSPSANGEYADDTRKYSEDKSSRK